MLTEDMDRHIAAGAVPGTVDAVTRRRSLGGLHMVPDPLLAHIVTYLEAEDSLKTQCVSHGQ